MSVLRERREATLRRGFSHIGLWFMACCLAAGGVLITKAMPSADGKRQKVHTKPIEQIVVGDRVASHNPELTAADRLGFSRIAPDDWRLVHLRLVKADGSLLRMALLRPASWLAESRPGERIELNLPEMGAEGEAEVVSVGPCPKLGGTCGGVVTGTFEHQTNRVLNLRLSDVEAIGVTGDHRFWSSDRQTFVPAEELRIGERVTGLDGEHVVESLTLRVGSCTVYNLEINGEHAYMVSASGILVHNACAANGPPSLTPEGAGRRGALRQALRDNGVPTSQQPARVGPNIGRDGTVQPGRVYEYEVPAAGGRTRTVRIRDDAGGHSYGPNDPQNRGPHFNDPKEDHYDY